MVLTSGLLLDTWKTLYEQYVMFSSVLDVATKGVIGWNSFPQKRLRKKSRMSPRASFDIRMSS